MTVKKWIYNFKTCPVEFFTIGLIFVFLVIWTIPTAEINKIINVEQLIEEYEQTANVTIFPYRRNLIKQKINEEEIHEEEAAKEIIQAIASQAPNRRK